MSAAATEAASQDKIKGQAYSAAQKDLREAHQDEFNGYYQKQLADRGIEWSPKPSKTDKAVADTLKLIEDDPDLATRLAEVLAQKLSEEGAAGA